MEGYILGLFISILLIPKISIWGSMIVFGVWGLLCGILKKIILLLRLKKTKIPTSEKKKGFFCGKIMTDNVIKSIHDDLDCVIDFTSIQPMSANFFPPVTNMGMSKDILIEVDGKSYFLEDVKKISGNDIYALPTEIDSENGKKYNIPPIKDIKKYMVIETILENNEKVLINGYVNEEGKIFADEIIGVSEKNTQKFLVSKIVTLFSLFLISFGVFMLITF